MLVELCYLDSMNKIYRRATEQVTAPPRVGEFIIKKNVGVFEVVEIVHKPDEDDFNYFKRYSVLVKKSNLTNY